MQVDYILHFVHVQYSCGGVLHELITVHSYFCVLSSTVQGECASLCVTDQLQGESSPQKEL